MDIEYDSDGWDAIDAFAASKVSTATDQTADDMTRYVPVDTGALQHTIEPEARGLTGRVYFGDPAEGVDYHLHQEYGTSKMEAQPYARPALYTVRNL